MTQRAERADAVESTPSASWQSVADRLVRYGWLILLGSVVVALAGGVLVALAPQPANENTSGGLPGLRDIPMIISMLGYGLAILLGVPSLLAGIWDIVRGRFSVGVRCLLPFVGPLLVAALIEIVPHVLNPCTLPYELGRTDLPGICETSPEWGADVQSRYHLLDHALVGALPMAVLYSLALRRWRPLVARLP